MAESKFIPRLMYVTDRSRARLPLPKIVVCAVAGGVDAVQVREKDLPTHLLLPLVREVRDVVEGRAIVLVNGNTDVAAALGIGVHLPETGPRAVDVRRVIGSAALIGRSVHNPASATETTLIDYVVAGHVFPTTSKQLSPPLGIAGLQAIASEARLPVLAIGGIDESNAAGALRAGAHGVAVVAAINERDDPRKAAQALRDQIDRFVWERRMSSNSGGTEINLTINGKAIDLERSTSISDFLATKGLTARMVVVELNGEVLPRSAFPSTILQAGDQVEVVHAVGGG
jgi:thiamine-phosphate pyrophosphorylase